MRRATTLGALLLAAATITGCGALGSAQDDPSGPSKRLGQSSGKDDRATSGPSSPTTDPDAPSGWGPTLGELAQARSSVEAMSLEQRVATVLMPGFWGYDGQEPSSAEAAQNQLMYGMDSPTEVVRAHGFGGFFLRPEVIGDADQVSRLAGQLHDAGDGPDGLPLLLSIDQEGGVVQRLKEGVDVVPSAAAVGASADPSYARKVARQNGRTLLDLGLTMVLAPVADVDPDGVSVIGSRAYSSDVDHAGEMVAATVEGYLGAGIVPVVKHFPGLGTVEGDSHRSLPVQPKTVAQLLRTDLVPFRSAIDAGAPVVMSAHVAVSELEQDMPASLSSAVLDGLLRDELGFDGVVITDSQGMGPIHGRYGPAEGAVRSLLAGNDLVLNSFRPDKARRAVIRAVESGRLGEDRVAEAATRVQALRIYQQRIAPAGG
ncbi:MAG: glycoside hydrolase family 3 protein [Actinomycetes bacterium]